MKRWIGIGAMALAAAGCGGGSGDGGARPEATPAPDVAPAPPDPLHDPAAAAATAPEHYRVGFETTKGPFVVEVTRAWAPRGADRFYNLVKLGYYDDIAFFRVLDGFVAQFGIHGDPSVSRVWRDAEIPDDPVAQSNTRGTLTFATAGPGTRTTQLFINFGDNSNLDRMGFSPFGRVVEGMEVVDSLYSGYGEGAPQGNGPDQGRVQSQGNEYLKAEFARLDWVKQARVLGED